MADPTPYDLLQDNQISALQDIVTPYYQPPGGQEHSFPVLGQGIDQDQFRLISRAAGKGTFVQHDQDGAQIAYRLVHHPGGPTETNTKNSMLLRPSSHTGRAETVSNGFFHVLTGQLEIPLPAVTTPTTYHICVTYDPRDETMPMRIITYPGTPPTTHGRDHVVLWTVHREPNQLLSDATLTQKAGWVSSVLTVFAYHQLPEPWSVDYGTLAVVVNTDSVPDLYTSRGVHGWIPLVDHQTFEGNYLTNGWENYGSEYGNFKATVSRGWVHLQGVIRNGQWSTSLSFAHLPANMCPSNTRIIPAWATGSNLLLDVRVETSGAMRFSNTPGSRPAWISFDGVSYPLN